MTEYMDLEAAEEMVIFIHKYLGKDYKVNIVPKGVLGFMVSVENFYPETGMSIEFYNSSECVAFAIGYCYGFKKGEQNCKKLNTQN